MLFFKRHRFWRVERIDGKAKFCVYGEEVWLERFAQQFFESGSDYKVRRGWHWRPQRSHMAMMLNRYGVVVSGEEIEHSLGSGRELIWPRLLELVVPLPKNWEAFRTRLSTSAKGDFRRAKRLEITSRVCEDRSRLRDFYDNFYVPSMVAAHGQRATILPWQTVEQFFDHDGEYVEMWQGEKQVGGFVAKRAGDTYRFYCHGWESKDANLKKRGLAAAIYFELFRRAMELEVYRVRLGGVSPILEGKLLAYKAKWRSRFSMDESDFPNWRVSLELKNPSVRWFFERNSLVIKNVQKNHFEVLSGRAQTDLKVPPELMASIEKWHRLTDWADGKVSIETESCFISG